MCVFVVVIVVVVVVVVVFQVLNKIVGRKKNIKYNMFMLYILDTCVEQT